MARTFGILFVLGTAIAFWWGVWALILSFPDLGGP